MILLGYLLKEAKKYCKASGIPFAKGCVPEEYASEIKSFVTQRLKKDRIITKKLELERKGSIQSIVLKLMDVMPNTSPIENYLADGIDSAGLTKYCRHQFQIGTKTVDFAFPIAHLVVEADGHEYHYETKWQLERDQERDKYLARKGWRVLHIEGLAIRRNIGLCIEKIEEQLKPYLNKPESSKGNVGQV